MAPVSRTIASLTGGVSQQAASLRRPSQMEMQENCFPSVVDGNKKRPPTEWVAELNGVGSTSLVHTINRDPSERYEVTLFDGALIVNDINGVAKSVDFPNGTSYLNAGSPGAQFRVLTIADYTFIVNTNVTVQMKADLTPTRPPEALIFVKQAEPSSTYSVTVNGTAFTYNTGSSGVFAKGIADNIMSQTGFPGTGVTATQDRACIWLQSASQIVLKAAGPNLDVDMRGFINTVQNFTDLPTIAPTDYFMEVTNTQANDFDNYYVKFKPNNAGQTFDTGDWEETVAQGVKYKLDPATMPHVLIRNSDGTFTFKEGAWANRTVGDDNTCPVPSFVDNTINDVVFHKGRLGFLSDSNFIGSETGQFFNFFRTTVTALLDTDPVDVAINQVAILRSAIEFDQTLLMFSDNPQYTLSGGDLLTPRTATTTPATKFESIPTTLPVATDKAVYFGIPKAGYSGVRELVIDPVSQKPDAPDVSAHVPKYINGVISKMSICQTENCLVALADGDSHTMYLYNFFWNGDQKLQSAWSKWTFGGTRVMSMEFINSVLYLCVLLRDGTYHLLKMDVSSSRTDSEDVDHLTNLDLRIDETKCTSITYDAGTDRTSFHMPYELNIDVAYQIVSRFVASPDIAGEVMQNVQIDYSNNIITCDGDQRGKHVYIGEQYSQQFVLSQQFVTYKDVGGADVVVPDAKLKMTFMNIAFEKTGYFRVQVDYAHRPGAPQITEFQGRVIESQANATDTVALEDGFLRVRVGGDSNRIKITVINDSFLPANFQSISWEGKEVVRTKQGA